MKHIHRVMIRDMQERAFDPVVRYLKKCDDNRVALVFVHFPLLEDDKKRMANRQAYDSRFFGLLSSLHTFHENHSLEMFITTDTGMRNHLRRVFSVEVRELFIFDSSTGYFMARRMAEANGAYPPLVRGRFHELLDNCGSMDVFGVGMQAVEKARDALVYALDYFGMGEKPVSIREEYVFKPVYKTYGPQ